MKINESLVKLDCICDYLPVFSTVTNLVDIFIKYVVLKDKSEPEILSDHYYTHIRDKNAYRYITLLPLIGNVVIIIMDVTKFVLERHRAKLLESVGSNASVLRFSFGGFTKDRDFMIKAIALNPRALIYAHDTLRDDEEVVIPALKGNGNLLWHVSERLKDSELCVYYAVTQNGLALEYASMNIRKMQRPVDAAVAQNPKAIEFAHSSIRNLSKETPLLHSDDSEALLIDKIHENGGNYVSFLGLDRFRNDKEKMKAEARKILLANHQDRNPNGKKELVIAAKAVRRMIENGKLDDYLGKVDSHRNVTENVTEKGKKGATAAKGKEPKQRWWKKWF